MPIDIDEIKNPVFKILSDDAYTPMLIEIPGQEPRMFNSVDDFIKYRLKLENISQKDPLKSLRGEIIKKATFSIDYATQNKLVNCQEFKRSVEILTPESFSTGKSRRLSSDSENLDQILQKIYSQYIETIVLQNTVSIPREKVLLVYSYFSYVYSVGRNSLESAYSLRLEDAAAKVPKASEKMYKKFETDIPDDLLEYQTKTQDISCMINFIKKKYLDSFTKFYMKRVQTTLREKFVNQLEDVPENLKEKYITSKILKLIGDPYEEVDIRAKEIVVPKVETRENVRVLRTKKTKEEEDLTEAERIILEAMEEDKVKPLTPDMEPVGFRFRSEDAESDTSSSESDDDDDDDDDEDDDDDDDEKVCCMKGCDNKSTMKSVIITGAGYTEIIDFCSTNCIDEYNF